MKIKEWVKENVDFRREESEVRENKGYYATMGAAGLVIGVIAGIVIIILQFAVSNQKTLQNWMNGVSIVAILAMIAFYVYMLLPAFKSPELDTASKVTTAIVSLLCIGGAFIAGIYITMILFMIVATLAIIWLVFKVWLSSNSSSSSSSYKAPPSEPSGPKKYELDNGTIVTEDAISSVYHGSDFHDYERNSDGTFSRINE